MKHPIEVMAKSRPSRIIFWDPGVDPTARFICQASAAWWRSGKNPLGADNSVWKIGDPIFTNRNRKPDPIHWIIMIISFPIKMALAGVYSPFSDTPNSFRHILTMLTCQGVHPQKRHVRTCENCSLFATRRMVTYRGNGGLARLYKWDYIWFLAERIDYCCVVSRCIKTTGANVCDRVGNGLTLLWSTTKSAWRPAAPRKSHGASPWLWTVRCLGR